MEQCHGNQSKTLDSFSKGNYGVCFTRSRYFGVVDRVVVSLDFGSCGGFPDLMAVVERVFHKPDSDDVAFVHIIKKSLRVLVLLLNWLDLF